MPTPQEHEEDIRYYAMWEGVVIDNKDPLGLHRVRIRIPGLVEKTDWALPMTAGGGSPQRGGHIVPAVGADVCGWFLHGDVERPRYAAGHWGVPKAGSEMPQSIKAANGEEHLVHAMQIENLLITYDERPRDDTRGVGKIFSIEDLVTGDNLTFDLAKGGLRLKATSLMQLVSDGILQINGLQVSINGRRVRPTKDQI